MKARIEELPSYHLAYMRFVGPYDPETIPALWSRFIEWMERRELLLPNNIRLGIAHDDPRVTPPERCRYDACLVVPPGFAGDDDVEVAYIPGGRFAVTEFVGTALEIRHAWEELGAWIAEREARPGSRGIEIYRGNPAVHERRGAFRCQLCLTIA